MTDIQVFKQNRHTNTLNFVQYDAMQKLNLNENEINNILKITLSVILQKLEVKFPPFLMSIRFI